MKTKYFSLFMPLSLCLSPMAVVISCRDNQINNEIEETPVLPSPETPISNIVNKNPICNDFFSQEFGVNIFNLDIFKDKTLDEIDFSLIKSAINPDFLDHEVVVSSPSINTSIPIIKNTDLNSFSFNLGFKLISNVSDVGIPNYDFWMTIYLPLQADSKEILDVNSFKELAAKATSEQYLNSFKETFVDKNSKMYQNEFLIDAPSFWTPLVNILNQNFMFYYNWNSFNYDLNNNDLFKFSFNDDAFGLIPPDAEVYRSYDVCFKNISSNKYEKITINNNIYLRITLGKDAIELKDNKDNKVYKNTHESSFYIDIKNWNN